MDDSDLEDEVDDVQHLLMLLLFHNSNNNNSKKISTNLHGDVVQRDGLAVSDAPELVIFCLFSFSSIPIHFMADLIPRPLFSPSYSSSSILYSESVLA